MFQTGLEQDKANGENQPNDY